jgi:sugar phosphate isomerase/epimerase
VGLRLSAAAAYELLGTRERPGPIEAFAQELESLGLYVFTLNGFPYGPFHGEPVKQAVYRPDWSDPERLRYTLTLAAILDRLLAGSIGGADTGSISTVPGGFRPETRDPAVRERIAAQLIHCAIELWRRHQAGGALIRLALEPEPRCMLETTAEALAFFGQHLLSDAAIARTRAATGVSPAAAGELLRRHLGLCIDTCHAAVEFEDPGQLLASVKAAGICIAKLQVTTGLRVAPVNAAAIEALRGFADPVYLHQVVATTDGGLVRFLDLPEAIAAFESGAHHPHEWRVHFHVPVFQRELPPFVNTDTFLEPLLAGVLRDGLCSHLEVETYTWSLLPPRYRARSVTEAIASELRWVLRRHESTYP